MVPQIVEVEVVELRLRDRVLEGRPYTAGLERSRKGGIRPVEAGALALLGEIAKRQGHPNQEMEHRVLDALALAETLEMRPLAARCHLLLAWLYHKGNRPPERENHETAARSLIQQIGCVKLDAAGVIQRDLDLI